MSNRPTIVEGDLNNPEKIILPSFGKEILTEGNDKTQIFRSGSEKETVSQNRKLIGWLYTFTNNPSGKYYVIYEGKNNIGTTANNDIVLTDKKVSGEHCRIIFRAKSNYLFIKDCGSTNGTWVNEEDILDEQTKLNDGDIITLGEAKFTLVLTKEIINTK